MHFSPTQNTTLTGKKKKKRVARDEVVIQKSNEIICYLPETKNTEHLLDSDAGNTNKTTTIPQECPVRSSLQMIYI